MTEQTTFEVFQQVDISLQDLDLSLSVGAGILLAIFKSPLIDVDGGHGSCPFHGCKDCENTGTRAHIQDSPAI